MRGISDRMKENYEFPYRMVLPMRLPTIIRIDGRCFHSFTRKMKRPFDEEFIENMAELTKYLCSEVSTSQLAYVQSDEISLLLHPYKKLESQAWFANEIQKMCSIAAGLASSWFSLKYGREAVFDARVFVIPETEVCNYYIWRQQDATRNSIQMLARSLYSSKQLHKKNVNILQDLIMEKGMNWNNLETYKKRGLCVVKKDGAWFIDKEIPIFTEKRLYIEDFLKLEEI